MIEDFQAEMNRRNELEAAREAQWLDCYGKVKKFK